MKVLHVLMCGHTGGIERLCFDIGLRSKEHNFFFIKGVGEIYEGMKKSGIKTFAAYNSLIKLKYNMIKKIVVSLEKLIESDKFESVIFHNGAPFLWIVATRLKKRNKRIKLFTYAHSNANDFLCKNSISHYIRFFVYKKMLKTVDGIIAISNSVKKSILYYFPKFESKIILNYNGIDLTKFNKTCSSYYSTLQIIYVGRLIEQKGVQNIIKMLSNIKDVDYIFSIVGDGDYHNDLKKLAENLGIIDKVNFLGTRDDIPSLLSKANIFMHIPEWEEGFGISVIEAMSAGLICIVNKNGAMEEIIDNNVNGYIVDNSKEKEFISQCNNIFIKTINGENQYIRAEAIKKSHEFSINATIERLNCICKDGRI